MFKIFLMTSAVVLFSLTGVASPILSTPAELSDFCDQMSGPDQHSIKPLAELKQSCRETIRNEKFQADALAICKTLGMGNWTSQAFEMLRCVRVIRDKNYTQNTIALCRGLQEQDLVSRSSNIINCLIRNED